MIKTILVTGGTGLIGQKLVDMLIQRGYRVHVLSRSEKAGSTAGIKTFNWDVYNRRIDPQCITGVDAIIHLAGESIGSKRWNDERKQQIRDSRTESIKLIYSLLRASKNQVEHVISASAVGYYGDRGDEILHEKSLPAKDFLAETCIEWEKEVDEGNKLGFRTVKLRSGIVLDAKEGALAQMARPVKFGLGTILGIGDQWISWIHLLDAVNMYIFSLENENMVGAYNMATPAPVTNRTLTKAISTALNRSAVSFHIPDFALKFAMGEMSILALGSTRVSSEKVMKTGFQFTFPHIEDALKDLYTSGT